jgi:hypothetical protein
MEVPHSVVRAAEVLSAGLSRALRGIDPPPSSAITKQVSARAVSQDQITVSPGYYRLFAFSAYAASGGYYSDPIPISDTLSTKAYNSAITGLQQVQSMSVGSQMLANTQQASAELFDGNPKQFATIGGSANYLWHAFTPTNSSFNTTGYLGMQNLYSSSGAGTVSVPVPVTMSVLGADNWVKYSAQPVQSLGGISTFEFALPYTSQCSVTTMDLQSNTRVHTLDTDVFSVGGTGDNDAILCRQFPWLSLNQYLYLYCPDLRGAITSAYQPEYFQGGGDRSTGFVVTETPAMSGSRLFMAGSRLLDQPPSFPGQAATATTSPSSIVTVSEYNSANIVNEWWD